jgi:oligosaccharide repeat unit polymerase
MIFNLTNSLVNFASCILISSCFLFVAKIIRIKSHIWTTPAGLFCMFWFFATFFPVVFLYYLPINPLAIAYILLCAISFSIPVFFTNWNLALKRNHFFLKFRLMYLNNTFITIVFIATLFLSLICLVFDTLLQGYSLDELFFNFIDISYSYMLKRYDSNLIVNIFGQMGLVLCYLSSVLGGFLYRSSSKIYIYRFVIILASFTPPAFVMLIQGAKGSFLLSLSLFIGSNILHSLLTYEAAQKSFVIKKSLLKYCFVFIFLLAISFYSRIDSSGKTTYEVFDKIKNYFYSYSFLHMPCFSDWLSFYIGSESIMNYRHEPLAFGGFTFKALFDLLGYHRYFPIGFYEEELALGDMKSNIFTIFRALITDFGLVGTPVVLALIGVLFNFTFISMLKNKYSVFGLSLFYLFIQFLYASFMQSAFIWNATYLVTLLLIPIFMINKFILERSRRTLV